MTMQILTVGTKVYFFKHFKFSINQEDFFPKPGIIIRNFWRENKNIFIVIIRQHYKYLRFNLELIIFKLKHKI